METKITRFVDLFLIFLILNSAIYLFDEVLPPVVKIYTITNNHKQVSFTEELKINKDLAFALLVEDSLNDTESDRVLLVEVDEATYYRAKKGNIAFLYFTPIYHHVRFCLDEFHPILKNQNPYNYRYTIELKNILMPLIIIGLAILGYKLNIFEAKFAIFLFTSIFAIVLKWLFR